MRSLAALTALLVAATLAADPADKPDKDKDDRTKLGPPVPQDANAIERRRKERLDFQRRMTVEVYDRLGKKNARWDAPARAALEALARSAGRYADGGNDLADAWGSARATVAAGCDDPQVTFLATSLGWQFDKNPTDDVRRKAADDYAAACKAAKYPPFVTAKAHVNAATNWLSDGNDATPDERGEARRRLDAALELLPAAAADESAVGGEWLYALSVRAMALYTRLHEGDRQTAYNKVSGSLGDHAATRWVRLALDGRYRIDTGWGGGLFGSESRERFKEAENSLTKAWEARKDSPVAAATLVLLASPLKYKRADMETWFARAMAADGDHREAVSYKLLYLDPGFGGSVEAMLGFGKQCVETKNWEGRLPEMLLEAHRRLSLRAGRTQKARDEYWHDLAAWADVKAVFDAAVAARPDSRLLKTEYARWAMQCAQPEEAHRLFTELGPKVWLPLFKDRAECEKAVADAKKLSGVE